MEHLSIVGISGSLRKLSFNTALLRASASVLGDLSADLTLIPIELPLYNADLIQSGAVERFKQAIEGAGAVLIATPEYNFGPPGPLKNAIDWASRPAYRSVFRDKPVGVIGASGSVVGTARAQGQLKQVLLGMASQVFPYPELLVGNAAQRFDERGQLTDDETRQRLTAYLRDFVAWVRRVQLRTVEQPVQPEPAEHEHHDGQ